MTRSLRTPRLPAAGQSAGFSLVELMVALALSLILLAGVLAIFASSRTTYETTDRLSRIQESGRFALDSIVRDLRSAGYLGCSRSAVFTNTLNEPTHVFRNFAFAVQGFDAQGTIWAPALDAAITNPDTASESDVLVIRRPRGDFEPVRVLEYSFMKLETDDISIENAVPALIKQGDVVQISDCNARGVFQVTANNGGTIKHAEVAAVAEDEETGDQPGNSSGNLGYAFTDAAELVPVHSIVYYLRDGSTPGAGTSLWRRLSNANVAEELVEGVENMQVAYGVAVGDTIEYRKADAVGDWADVRTVRIALLVKSLSEYGTDTDQADYQLLDDEVGKKVSDPGDRRLRQIFTTTVNIRNIAS